jgi:hypothetical protein
MHQRTLFKFSRAPPIPAVGGTSDQIADVFLHSYSACYYIVLLRSARYTHIAVPCSQVARTIEPNAISRCLAGRQLLEFYLAAPHCCFSCSVRICPRTSMASTVTWPQPVVFADILIHRSLHDKMLSTIGCSWLPCVSVLHMALEIKVQKRCDPADTDCESADRKPVGQEDNRLSRLRLKDHLRRGSKHADRS